MKAFLAFVIMLNLLAVSTRLRLVVLNPYPRIQEVPLGFEIVSIIADLGIALWAVLLLC